MNYSGSELLGTRTAAEPLIEAGLKLLAQLGPALFAAISELGHGYDLTPTQVKVLLHLGVRGQMTVGEIATALATSMPAASELVDRLVEAGHLERGVDPADRRRVLIVATPAAQRITAHLSDLRRAQLCHALGLLEPEERPMFVRSIEALVAALNTLRGFDLPGWSEPNGAHCGDSGVNAAQPALREGEPVLAGEREIERGTDD